MNTPLTYEDLEAFVEELKKHPAPKEMKIQMFAGDYDFMSDEQFKAMVTSPNISFIGGKEAVEKMRARCNKLNIK